MKNYSVEVSYSKYKELREGAIDPDTSEIESNWMQKYYKCRLLYSSGWNSPKGRVMMLSFTNEQDYIWFRLKHI